MLLQPVDLTPVFNPTQGALGLGLRAAGHSEAEAQRCADAARVGSARDEEAERPSDGGSIVAAWSVAATSHREVRCGVGGGHGVVASGFQELMNFFR